MNFPTRQEFEAWLRSLPSDQEVAPLGYGGCNCPIATFVLRTTKREVEVSPCHEGLNFAHYWEEEKSHSLPQWANKFAMAADEWASLNGHSTEGLAPITAARALALLEGIAE